jgi:hypothetical protein
MLKRRDSAFNPPITNNGSNNNRRVVAQWLPPNHAHNSVIGA